MTSPLSTIDLSLLPPPDVVEPIDFEALLRAMLARLAASDPAFAEVLESDPAAKVLEANTVLTTEFKRGIEQAGGTFTHVVTEQEEAKLSA